MSRCFPFPPPGYEAKPMSEHKDLLKKEKHREKKCKKERKHRRKRERKEKDRDHRKDKHNKKHKREKHRDGRKNKDSDEDKKQTLEQETQKSDDLGNRRPQERVQNEVIKDIKPADELVPQILGQEGHANHTGSSTSKLLPRSTESFGAVGSKEKERTSSSRVVQESGQTTQHNHGMVQKNDNIAYDNEKGKDGGLGSKTRIQNGKSFQAGSAEKHSTGRHNCNGVGLQQESSLCIAQKGFEGVRATTTVIPGAGRSPNDRITPSPDDLRATQQVGQHSDGSSHSAYGKSDSMSTKRMMEKENGSANNFQTRMGQQLVLGKYETVQGKTKIKELKANHRKGVKDHYVKKRKAKDKNKEKEKEKKGDVNEQKHKKLDARGASKHNIDDLMDSAHLNEKNFTSDDVKKRKNLGANSSLHAEHSMRMTKLPRMSPANPPYVNGETLKHAQGTAPCSSKVPVGTNTCEADRLEDSKECYNNGITRSHNLEKHTASVSSSSNDSNEVSLKPPHPDTKYLSKVYSIPAVVDCSGYIDQDWLFSGDHVDQKTLTSEAAESPQVWAEAQLIDSADVVALPYVVPL